MNKNIIGYFHICQKDHWQKSFDMIFNEIKNSGLYDVTNLIRIGIVNDVGSVINDERLNDPKFQILFCNSSQEYERPTLLHMRNHADIDPNDTYYWYVHSKGIRHFGKERDDCIIDWINFLLYFNVTKWKLAIDILERYDTYGCNRLGNQHYSGNFWWANRDHLTKLPLCIEDYYIAPEDYICKKNDKAFNIYTCGLVGAGHYWHNISRNEYEIPVDFNIHAYWNSNPDIQSFISLEDVVWHYLNYGKYEGRNYKLPEGFDFNYYRNNKNLYHYDNGDLIWHWFKYGQYEGIKYCE